MSLSAYTTRWEKTLVILDADDTLWETQGLFERAKTDLHALLAPADLTRDELAAQLDLIDAQAVKTEGFARSRFGNSMLRLYDQRCAAQGTQPSVATQIKIGAVAERIYTSAPHVYPGVREALSALHDQAVVVLLTKGDLEVQYARINASGLAEFFDDVFVVPDKTAETFRYLTASADLLFETMWSVGNSARSDINPALAAGLRGILVHPGAPEAGATWIYEREQPAPGAQIAKGVPEAVHLILQSAAAPVSS